MFYDSISKVTNTYSIALEANAVSQFPILGVNADHDRLSRFAGEHNSGKYCRLSKINGTENRGKIADIQCYLRN